ncbi:DUF6142 family protein [Lachnospiraceae bacterium LCP25S3_G4]
MILKGKEKERDKAKERKNRGNRKYGQAKLKHSKKGMISCVCAGCIAFILLLLLYTAYLHRGSAAGYIGGLGLSAMIFSWVGFTTAIKGLRERDKNYLTCRLGIGFNGLFLVCFLALFLRGIM